MRSCVLSCMHVCTCASGLSSLKGFGKRSKGNSAGVKQIMWQGITVEKAVASANGFEMPRARAIAGLNFEHCRETIRQ